MSKNTDRFVLLYATANNLHSRCM